MFTVKTTTIKKRENGKEHCSKKKINLPMNNGAFSESEKFITKWINRDVTIVVHWIH